MTLGNWQVLAIFDHGLAKYTLKDGISKTEFDLPDITEYIFNDGTISILHSRSCTFYQGKNYQKFVIVTGTEDGPDFDSYSLLYNVDTNAWQILQDLPKYRHLGRNFGFFNLGNALFQIRASDHEDAILDILILKIKNDVVMANFSTSTKVSPNWLDFDFSGTFQCLTYFKRYYTVKSYIKLE